MFMLNFAPTGTYRQWQVKRNNVVIASIGEGGNGRGLVLNVEGAGLNITEMEAVSLFMTSQGEDESEQARR